MKTHLKLLLHTFLLIYRYHFKKNYPLDIDVIKSIVKNDNGIIIDIGAHVGSWTFNLAKCYPQASIIAIEAFPYYYKLLKYTNTFLSFKNIRFLNFAVSDNSGILQLKYLDEDGNHLTGFNHISQFESISNIEVKSETIDNLINSAQDKVVFIKCDIEGFELMAFKGASNTIDQFRPIIYTEINKKWCERYSYKPEEILSFFERKNYVPYQIRKNTLVTFNKKSIVDFEGDLIFLPK